ncbi:MAG: AI-2E family transporter [Oscillospiraceae bacterium]
MKFEWNKKYFIISIYTFGVLSAAILFYFGASKLIENLLTRVSLIFNILKPIFYGLLVAYVMNPVIKVLEKLLKRFCNSQTAKKIKIKKPSKTVLRGLSIAFAWFMMLALLTFMISVIIPCIDTNITKIIANSDIYFQNFNKGVAKFEGIMQYPQGVLVNQINSLIQNIEEIIAKSAQHVLSHIFNITKQITTGVINAFIAIIISIYFLFSKELFCAQIKKMLSAFVKDEKVEKLFASGREVNLVFNNFLFGKLLDSLIVGILCYLGMLPWKIPYAVLISSIVGITNIIPYFGPFIGAVPCIIILLLENPTKALIFTIFILILQQIDGNIIGPKVLGETIGLNSFWVMFSIILFGGLFGVVGMFLGVPIFAAFYVFFKRLIEDKLAKKAMPTDTLAYMNK